VPDDDHDWCAGLPVTRTRQLAVEELRRLRWRRRSTMATALGWLVGVPLVLVACAASISILLAPAEWFMSIVVVLGLFVAGPLCIVMSNDYFKRASALRRQSRDTEVLVCEGAATDLLVDRRGLEKLRRQIEQSSPIVLEVLKDSSLVWTINGQPQQSWVVVPRGRTVARPDHARLAAQYVRPVDTADGTFRVHQRRLSEKECSELRSYLPSVRPMPGIVALVANVIAVAHLLAYIRRPVGVPLIGIVLLTVAGWCDAQFVLLLLARRRMLRDLRERTVVIYQPDPAVDASEASVMEFLPHSGAEWTTGGRAAPWRRLHGPTL
jgi:hypothetical protein